MKTRGSISVIMFFLIGLFLIAGPTLATAEEGVVGVADVGMTVNPYDMANVSADVGVTPQSVPMMYSDDVLQLKQQMQGAGNLSKRGRRGAEADESGVNEGSGISITSDAPTLSTNFAGISYTGWYPPDQIMAVGPSHVLVMVNSSLAIYEKTGGAAVSTSTLGDWFSNVSPGTTMIFDPKCAYDQWNGRYILLALALNTTSNESYYLISVSQTNDATGLWWNWKLNAKLNGSTDTSNWADYPQIGFDSSTSGAVYITSNQFAFGGNFQYSKLRILKKSELYAGSSLTWYDFWNKKNSNGSAVFTWQPVQTMSSTTGEWLVNTVSSSSGNAVSLWKVTNPTSATPTLKRVANVSVRAYSAPPDGKQKGGTTLIDTGDCRLYNAVFQNNHVYTTTTEAYKWGDNSTESAIRYLKISTSTQKTVLDKTYGGNEAYYSYPAINVDSSDNIYLVFSRYSSKEYGCVRFSGRKTTDTKMQGSASLKAGEAYYVRKVSQNRNRWGDYSGIARDPSNGSIWLYGEYAKPSNQWGTWIGKTKF